MTAFPTLLTPSATFTRPGDTTSYTSGDLVANSTTAGSVVPMSFKAVRSTEGGGCQVRRVRLKKSTNTTTAASFRLHLYTASPTCANGDNGVWSTTESGYLGSFDLDASGSAGRVFSDSSVDVIGVPAAGSEITAKISGLVIYGLLEARGAYAPGNAEVFTVTLEVAGAR